MWPRKRRFTPPGCDLKGAVGMSVLEQGRILPRASLLALFAGIALLVVAGCSSSGDGDDVPRLTFGGSKEYRGVVLLPPLSRPAFTLTDTSGQPFAFDRQTKGRLTLLFFGYTNCPDICPTTMSNIASGLKGLSPAERSRISVVFVTTDPKRDSAGVLRGWLDHFDAAFIGLTGEQAEINGIMTSLRLPDPIQTEVTDQGYSVSHVSSVIVFTADDVSHIIYPEGTSPADWLHEVPKLLNEGWHEPKG